MFSAGLWWEMWVGLKAGTARLISCCWEWIWDIILEIKSVCFGVSCLCMLWGNVCVYILLDSLPSFLCMENHIQTCIYMHTYMHIRVCKYIYICVYIYMKNVYLSLKIHKDFSGDIIPLVLACLATVLLSFAFLATNQMKLVLRKLVFQIPKVSKHL